MPILHDRVRLILVVFLLMSGVAGVIYALSLGPTLRFLPDESDYLTLARNLLAGAGYSLDGHTPSAFRAPGVVGLYLLSAATPAPIIVARCLNYACLNACAAVIFALLRRMCGSIPALVGAVGCVLYPLAFFTAGTLYPQTFGALLTLVSLALWFWSRPALVSTPTLAKSAVVAPVVAPVVAAGLAAGLATLTIPTLLPSLAAVFVTDALVSQQGPQNRLRRLGLACLSMLCALLVLVPWTLRNRLQLGVWVPVSTNGGFNLLLGNSENTTPNAGTNVDISRYMAQVASADEVAQDRALAGFAMAWMRAHPLDAARLYAKKALNFFNYRNDLTTQSESSPARDLISACTYYPLLIIAIIGIVLSRRLGYTPLETGLWVAYLSGALVTAIFFTRLRFRVPYDVLLIVLASMTLGRLVNRRQAPRHA